MAKMVEEAGVESVVISGTIEEVCCIPDKVGCRGPIGGLYSVVNADLRISAVVLIVPVDMPKLSATLLRHLLSQLDSGNVYRQAVHFDKYEMPAVFVANEALKRHLKEMMVAGDGSECSIRALLKRVDAAAVALDQDQHAQFVNVNYPEDWVRIGSEAAQ